MSINHTIGIIEGSIDVKYIPKLSNYTLDVDVTIGTATCEDCSPLFKIWFSDELEDNYIRVGIHNCDESKCITYIVPYLDDIVEHMQNALNARICPHAYQSGTIISSYYKVANAQLWKMKL
jgi:hypothetical protein